MLAHKNGVFHSHNQSLVAVRAALRQAADRSDDVLLTHIRLLLETPRLLHEVLKAIQAAGEEHEVLAEAANRLWPSIMDMVLDHADSAPQIFAPHFWGDHVLANLIPNPAYKWGYLTLEPHGDPIVWNKLTDVASQVDRWIQFAMGKRGAIDALVIALHNLDVTGQIEVGLAWVERIVGQGGEGCCGTFTLPEWLRDRRADLVTAEQNARWQRVVDILAISGDTRVADLAD
jgi:hypothetical protein